MLTWTYPLLHPVPLLGLLLENSIKVSILQSIRSADKDLKILSWHIIFELFVAVFTPTALRAWAASLPELLQRVLTVTLLEQVSDLCYKECASLRVLALIEHGRLAISCWLTASLLIFGQSQDTFLLLCRLLGWVCLLRQDSLLLLLGKGLLMLRPLREDFVLVKVEADYFFVCQPLICLLLDLRRRNFVSQVCKGFSSIRLPYHRARIRYIVSPGVKRDSGGSCGALT